MKKMKKKDKKSKTDKKLIDSKAFKEKYLRALADYQNLEKRVLDQEEQVRVNAVNKIVNKLLPILDDLERAEREIPDRGLDLIVRKFNEILKSENIEKLKVKNSPFDPNFMECVELIEGEKDGYVIEELRGGYKMGDEVIRVAQVRVGKKN